MLVDDLIFIADRSATAALNATRVGVVASTSPFQVTLWGDSASRSIGFRLSSYTPVNGDKVVIIEAGRQLICLGKIQVA